MLRTIKSFLLGSLLCVIPPLDAHPPFVAGELIGQLGNQFFVTAATISLALDHGATLVFPDFIHKHSDNIPLNYQKIFFRLNTSIPANEHISRYYNEPHLENS